MSRYRAAPGVVSRPLSDGGLFVVDARSGAALGLSRSAREMFELVCRGSALDAVAAELVGRYGVDRAVLRADAGALCAELLGLGVIEPITEDDDAPRP